MTDFGGARYSDSSFEAIVQAYYARATATPDTARGRAQAAYGIATAVQRATATTRANVASAVAMVATLATFALAMFLPAETFSASVSVSPTSGLTSTACLRQPHVIKGDVVASSVQSNLVEIRRATVCGDTIETLYVDRQRIIEVRVTE
jgi:hypothetical protein